MARKKGSAQDRCLFSFVLSLCASRKNRTNISCVPQAIALPASLVV